METEINSKLDIERKIYELSIEDILMVMEEEDIELELNEKNISFLEQKIGELIDWRTPISIALSDLEDSLK